MSEFTDKHKFMCVNALNSSTDVNALLRQIAVTFPEPITWRDERSYMLADLVKVDRERKELQFQGYVKNNLLNVKRLLHITGVSS